MGRSPQGSMGGLYGAALAGRSTFRALWGLPRPRCFGDSTAGRVNTEDLVGASNRREVREKEILVKPRQHRHQPSARIEVLSSSLHLGRPPLWTAPSPRRRIE